MTLNEEVFSLGVGKKKLVTYYPGRRGAGVARRGRVRGGVCYGKYRGAVVFIEIVEWSATPSPTFL